MSKLQIHKDSIEYLYLPFTSDVDPVGLANGQVAFTATRTLGDAPTWIPATVVTDEPTSGTNALRILFGDDWSPDPGQYVWWAKFVDNPEVPVEKGDNTIIVYS